MTSPGAALRTVLLRAGTVAALIGDRMYPGLLPQTPTLPALVYVEVRHPSIGSHGGSSGLVGVTFQVDAWAETYEAAYALQDAVRVALTGKDAPRKVLVDGRRWHGALVPPGGPIPDLYDPAVRMFRRSSDYLVWMQEEK